MAEHQEGSIKSLSISSWDNRFSFGSSTAEAFQGDEEFYEEIEAPKFVDFTAADHFCPDDRYWFCGRFGCDQKHEEEMDSEAIYKKFVLRAMAARSPNVIRIRKILDRDASRKCPLSAPPKLSKPRLTKMAITSSFPEKVNEKAMVLKPKSTPVAKGKPVSSKYLTTPRIRKSKQEENSFPSVQNPKPNSTGVSKSRMVAKALVFHSPNKKKAVKVKTSVELRTPVSKLCDGEISSQKKGYSGKSSVKLGSSRKVLRRPEETLCWKTKESKSGMSIRSKIKGGKPSQRDIKEHLVSDLQKPTHEEATHDLDLGLSDDSKGEGDYFDLCLKTSSIKESKLVESKNEESHEIKEQSSVQKVSEVFGLEEFIQEEEALRDLDLALSDYSKGEEGDDLGSQATNMQEKNSSDRKETVDQMTENDPSGRERDEQQGYEDDDDNKENAAVSDENRMHEKNPKKNGKKILAVQNGKKVVATQAQDKKLKEGQVSSTSVMKLKKPKATNPKPFRLRTDERGILKERRTEHVAPKRESLASTPSGKLQMKQGNDVQGIKTPEHKKHLDRKPTNSPSESKAMQRLERFKKISSLQKHSAKPQELVSTKKETTSFLIPGQKLDVILESSPEVLALKRAGKADDPSGDDAAASQPLSRVRRVAAKPILRGTNVPRKGSCITKQE